MVSLSRPTEDAELRPRGRRAASSRGLVGRIWFIEDQSKCFPEIYSSTLKIECVTNSEMCRIYMVSDTSNEIGKAEGLVSTKIQEQSDIILQRRGW
jgi:hypothetical protein